MDEENLNQMDINELKHNYLTHRKSKENEQTEAEGDF